MKSIVSFAAIAYLVVLLCVWLMLATDQGTNWLITLLLLSPRWLFSLPIAFLLPITLAFHARIAAAYVVHLGIVLFPIMGFEYPEAVSESVRVNRSIVVSSCSVGGGRLDNQALMDMVDKQKIDVLLMQESSSTQTERMLNQRGWDFRSVNNLVIASRYPIDDAKVLVRHPALHYRTAAAISCKLLPRSPRRSAKPIQLVCVHLPTFRPVMEAAKRFDRLSAEQHFANVSVNYRRIVDRLISEIDPALPAIIGGDFNVPRESCFYRDYWDGFQNAHCDAGAGFGHTKFTRFHGVRIDHVLTTPELIVLDATVHASVGGDHRPVITTIAWDDR